MFGWIKSLFSRKRKHEVTLTVKVYEPDYMKKVDGPPPRHPSCGHFIVDYDKLEHEQDLKHARYIKSLKNQMNLAMCSRLMRREKQRGKNRDKAHRKRKSQARNWKRWREKC